jgi:hypothetical protein
MVGSFSSPNKTGKARTAVHLRFTQNPRKKKERFGCGMQFSEGRSRIFLLEGGWWLSRMHIPNQTWLLPKNAVRRRGYAKQLITPRSRPKMSQHFWSRPGCDQLFFRSYRRSAILVIFARSFLTQEELDPL